MNALLTGFASRSDAPKKLDRPRNTNRLLKAIVVLSIPAVLVAAVAIGNFVSYLGSGAEVYIADETASRPDPLTSEIEVSFLLHNDGPRDAAVVVEYWFGSDARGIASSEIDGGDVRTISRTFNEPRDGRWDVRLIEVMFH